MGYGGPMINQERIKNLLLELVQIDSHSRKERDVAERIKKHCEEMGAQVEIDDAGEKVGGNSGNVIARFPGTIANAQPIMMSAHMDTVVPGEGVKPIVEGDIIRTDETTVLGGDDKSGCSVIIEVIRCLQEQNIPHTPIEAIFSICEEVGLLGAKNVDVSKLKAKYGIVFDSDDPGFLFTKGPSSNHMEFRIHGLESHIERDYSSMDVPDSSHVVQLVIQAAKRMGLDVKTMASGGGCDANVFNRKGIECANLGTGMRAIHTVKEWLDVKDMYAAAEMTLEIMKLNGEMAAK